MSYESYEDEFENELEQENFNELVQNQLQRTPWWLISLVFHAILAFIATIIAIKSPSEKLQFQITASIEPLKIEEIKPELKREVFKETKPVKENEPTIKDPVVKQAEVSDHHETDNQENFQMSKGQKEAASDSPLQGKFSNSFIGGGGAAGGAFGSRFGGRKNLLKQGGGSQLTEDAVKAGLEWLKRHQSSNGSWDTDGYSAKCGSNPSFSGHCKGNGHAEYDAAMTGLALLCFLGAGHTSTTGTYKEQVKKSLRYLTQAQDDQGCIGNSQSPRHMYSHAIATLALAEAYALSNHNPLLKTPTEKAIAFLLKAQTQGGGWRYTSRPGDDDTSVMGWCVMALRAARLAGIHVPDSSFLGAKNFLSQVTSLEYRTGYRKRSEIEFEGPIMSSKPIFGLSKTFLQELESGTVSENLRAKFRQSGHPLSEQTSLEQRTFNQVSSALGSSVSDNKNTSWFLKDQQNNKKYVIDGKQLAVFWIPKIFAASEAMTAVSITSRVFMKSDRNEPHFAGGAAQLLQNLPTWGDDANGYSLINYYYWYYGTLAMFQMGKDYWSNWNDRIKDILVQHQEKHGCIDGSWPPEGKRCGVGGRVYATTLSILCLEIYYRYDKVFK